LPQVNGRLEFGELLVNFDWQFYQWFKQTIEPSVSQRFSTAAEALERLRSIDLKANSSVLATDKEHKHITVEHTSNRLVLKIVGYGFEETISSMGLLIMLTAFVTVPFSSLFFNEATVWFISLSVLAIPLSLLFIAYGKIFQNFFVASFSIDQKRMYFQVKVFNFLRIKKVDIPEINKILKIEQILYNEANGGSSLILWDGVKRNSIQFTEPEARYIGEHLSAWLKVPFKQHRVTRVHPNVKSQEI
jgi:hypothetical protein